MHLPAVASPKIRNMQIFTPSKREEFFQALRDTCNVTIAARAGGVSRMRVYQIRAADPDFAQQWDDALQEGIDMLEREAHRRAFGGTDKPLTYQGQFTYLRDPETGNVLRDAEGNPRIATVKEHSDVLAMFLLKAHRPEKYRENSKLELAGSLAVTTISDDELEAEIARLAAQVGHSALSATDPLPPPPDDPDDASDLV